MASDASDDCPVIQTAVLGYSADMCVAVLLTKRYLGVTVRHPGGFSVEPRLNNVLRAQLIGSTNCNTVVSDTEHPAWRGDSRSVQNPSIDSYSPMSVNLPDLFLSPEKDGAHDYA